MKLALKEAMIAPSVLANAMHHVSTGANITPLALVNKGTPNKVTEPETSDVEDVDRTPVTSSAEEVVSLPTASDYQRHDAWMKLNCPPRNVPCLRKKLKVEHVTPEGNVIVIEVRQRVPGKLPIRTVAVGSGYSTAKVQILESEVAKDRQRRSDASRINGGTTENVVQYVSNLADKEVLDQHAAKVEHLRWMDRATLLACMLHSRKRHAEWQSENGGNTMRKRHGSVLSTVDKAANDSNIEQFRGEEVQGVPIGTAHPSDKKFLVPTHFELAKSLSATPKVKRSFNVWKAIRSAKAQYVPSKPIVRAHLVGSLFNISALENARGAEYMNWLREKELDNPVITNDRIRSGTWTVMMDLLDDRKVLASMQLMNDRSNQCKAYLAQKAAKKKWGKFNAKRIALVGVPMRLQGPPKPVQATKVTTPVAVEATAVVKKRAFVGAVNFGTAPVAAPVKPFKLYTPSSSSMSMEESVREHVVLEAIATQPLAVWANGVWVQVSQDMVRSALTGGESLPVL